MSRTSILLLAGFIIYVIFFISGIKQVPFHPDESTQIWMSSEVLSKEFPVSDQFFSTKPEDITRQHYRLIDAPLTRIVIGLANRITRQSPLPADWNWSADWQQNVNAGALPSPQQLFISRIAVSIWVPIGLVLFYLTLRRYSSITFSIMGVLLLAFHAGLLLHSRRAMAEPLLLALYLFIIWRFLKPYSNTNLILISIGLGLLLQTKQTSAPMLLSTVVFLIFSGWQTSRWKGVFKSILIPLGIIAFLFFALNPIMWKDPFHVIGLMLKERILFSQTQYAQLLETGSGLAFPTIPDRLIGTLAQVYFAPPAFFDVGNYARQMETSINVYQSNTIHTLFSGWLWGGWIFFASSAALILSTYQIIVRKISWNSPQWKIIIISSIHLIFYVAFLNIGFQRYYLPFFPLIILLIIFSLNSIHWKRKQG